MNKWFLAYKERSIDLFDLDNLTVIEPPQGTYYADPFLVKHNGKTYVFFEDYDYNKGTIACSELNVWDPQKVLEEDYHLSFPSIFKYEGEFYMIPETLESHEIRLYKCTEFPFKWKFDSVLYSGGCFADVTFHQDETGCYLFTTVNDDNRLWILKSNELHGDWEPYKREYAPQMRNAGRIFKHNSNLIRPVQISDPTYGHSMSFRKLTLDPFEEVEIAKIEPDWMEGLIGTHTFNMSEDYIIIDGKVKI